MSELNRQTVKDIGEAIQAACSDVAKRFGVSIEYAGGNFSANLATVKLQVGVIGADGRVSTKESEAFHLLCKFYGLTPDMLGREFEYRGRRYTIKGCTTSDRYPISVDRDDGKGFKFSKQILWNAGIGSDPHAPRSMKGGAQ